MRIAAVDQGTTSTRSLLVQSDLAPIVMARRVHRQIYPHPGWVEHDPAELLDDIRACLAAAGEVDAIGIANQGESCLAWHATTGAPLSPLIVWQDMRTAGTLATLNPAQQDRILALSGLPVDAYFSASKLGWLLLHNPAVAQAHKEGQLRLGTSDAFFLQNLTGHCVTDVTTASRTGMMNIAKLAWDAELCALYGVPIETLPPIVATMGDFGSIDGVPVRASVVDQQAALYGHGCRQPGDAKVTFGTGAFASVVTGGRLALAPQHGILPTIAWSGPAGTVRAADGGVYDAGSALEWAKRLGLFENFAELDTFDRPTALGRGLACVPALSGLGCPHWDRSAASLFIGMTAATDKRDLCQALLEGLAYLTADVIAALDAVSQVGDRISIDGGLSQSSYFCQMLANATGRTIAASAFSELTGVGLAGLAAGGAIEIALDQPSLTCPREDAPDFRPLFDKALSRSLSWR